MDGCAAEHHARKVSLGETGDTDSTRGIRNQGVGKFLQGGGAGNFTVWVGDVGPFSVDGEEGGRGTHWDYFSDNGKLSKAAKIRDMGDVWGRRCTGGSRNTDGEDLYMETAGKCGSVGGATSSI